MENRGVSSSTLAGARTEKDIDISTHNKKLTATRNKKCAILEDFIKVLENVSYNRKTQRKRCFSVFVDQANDTHHHSKGKFAPTLDVCLVIDSA